MGAWGPGAFENDDALDWVADMEEADGWEVIRAAFRAAHLGAEDYLEAPEASAALAAAEVIAALRGAPIPELPAAVVAWVDRNRGSLDAALLEEARQAVANVRTIGELRALWEETGEESYRSWEATVADLQRRLA